MANLLIWLTGVLTDIYSFCNQIGTDIEDFKCSWLVVKALEICNEEQKKLLHVRVKSSTLFYSLSYF